MEQSMASLDLLVIMLIVCSGVLAFITLYNLTNINIMERTREIATVKVLGFTPWETASYVLRENRLLSLLGALLGLVLGKGLHTVVIRAIVVDNMSIDARIAPMSYLVSFAATIVFTLLTNALMRPRLEKINMAESLKSVE
jgi:putative ABC transport system permease protein